MTRYANRYLVLTAIGWLGKTLPAGASLVAEPSAKTEALLAQGAIQLDVQASIDHDPTVIPDGAPLPQAVPWESLTVSQLTEMAAAEGIDLLGVKKKADIIELIVAHQAALMAAGEGADEDAGTQPADPDTQEGTE